MYLLLHVLSRPLYVLYQLLCVLYICFFMRYISIHHVDYKGEALEILDKYETATGKNNEPYDYGELLLFKNRILEEVCCCLMLYLIPKPSIRTLIITTIEWQTG